MRFLITCLVSVFLLASCVHTGDVNPYGYVSRTQWIMGTDVSLLLPPSQHDYFHEAFAVFREVDEKLSTYKEDSEISQLNRKHLLQVSALTYEALKLAKKMYRKTRGYFDPTLGQWTHGIYGFDRKNTEPPTSEQVLQAKANIGGQNLQLGPQRKVRLKNQVQLDLGGIGKGYAVDLAFNKLKELGVKDGQIAASGDIRCLSLCRIEVVNPFEPSQIMAVMEGLGADSAISTSGTYEKYVGSQATHHLLEPKSGRPSRSFVSVTLFGRGISNAELDAWTTALSVMPVKLAKRVANSSDLFAAILVTPDKKAWTSKDFYKFAAKLDWLADDISLISKKTSQTKHN